MNATTTTGLRIEVLGTLRAERDGTEVELGGPKQRAVLAMIVSEATGSIGRDRIIEGVWGEEASDENRHAFYTYLSNLRRVLGDVIVRTRDTYSLGVEPENIDHLLFIAAVDEARGVLATDPGTAALTLREALGLWRGRPYADLVDFPGLEPEVRRLEELRLEAVELRVEAELAAGLHGPLVGELEALAEEHPLRERFRAQHMLALYRSGRQADALRAYRRTESLLAEELGVEPSEELRDLELKILEHDDSLLVGPGRAVTQRLGFLVTDIEGSTRRWDRHPRAMATALATHDGALRRAIEEAGGRLFKHTGDGVLAAFPDSVSATEAAETAQRSLEAAEWGEVGTLRVRMGIDVGEAEARGGDFFGPPLNRAARLCAIGHGGQVLVSAAAQTEVVASAPPGVQIRQLGEYQLRGMANSERVAQLVFVGLPADFPDLRIDAEPALDDRTEILSLPGYEVRDRIGEGAFGVVWSAYQPSVGREVAVKMIRPELASQPSFVRRFEAEARTIARLAHPHIVPLIDFWRDTESAYLVLGMLPGGSLAVAMEVGTVDPPAARRILEHVGTALDHAHSQGMVHGDLKPANVLLDGASNAYLSDFGIAARLLYPEVVGSVSSAPAYRPPEEATTGPTREGDLFALGVLARELLDEDPQIETVLSRATAPNPADRYSSAAEFLAALDQVLGKPSPGVKRPVVSRNPYKGLRAFDEGDAGDFYGRDELVATLVTAVSERRLVAVVGPSGSGKSSVVRAGLLPALARGGIDGSGEWLRTVLTPGSDPLDALAEAVEAVSTEPVGVDRLDKAGLGTAVDGDLLLVVDQFEELFTLVDDPDQRERFIDLICAAVEGENSRVRIVATLRADFYDKPLEEERMGRLVRDGLVTVLPPAPEELVEMITAPAQAVGLRWEPGLPHRIAEDVAHQPGGLPLMQYALTELVERRSGDLLTASDYTRVGGAGGALAMRAESLYQDLTPSQQEAARQILLRLVTVDEDTDDTRRRVRRSELESVGIPRSDLENVLDTFITQRLLLADRDPATRGPTVEVAHEALLRQWPRLQGWVDDQREGLILGRRFRAALAEWETNQCHDDYLLTGNRLAPFTGWSEATTFTPDEQNYYEASLKRDQAERTARRRRRRTLTGILAAAAVVATTLGIIAAVQAERAGSEARTANSRRLAGDATVALSEDPELAILLALESAYLSRDAGEALLPETIAALQQTTQTSRLDFRLEGAFERVAVSPDGSLLATNSATEVVIWDAGTGQQLRRLPGEMRAADVAFSPDGSLLAVAYWSPDEEDATGGYVGLWDTLTWTEVDRLGRSALRLSWSPDGRLLATATNPEGNPGRNQLFSATVWEVDTGNERFSVDEEGRGVAFADNETLLVTDEAGMRVALYGSFTGEAKGHLDTTTETGWPYGLSVDPERNQLLVSFFGADLVELWDLETRSWLWSHVLPGVAQVVINAETGSMASGGIEGTVNLHDPDTGLVVATLPGHTADVNDLAFYPSGDRLVSVAVDGETRVWDVTPSGAVGAYATEAGISTGATGLQLSPHGDEAAVTLIGALERFDLATRELLGSFVAHLSQFTLAPISPDWRLVAYVDSAGEATVRDLATGDIVTTLPPCTIPRAFTHDGSALVLDGVSDLDLVTPCDDDPPAGAEMRSRVIDVATGEDLYDLGAVPVGAGWPGAVFNPAGVFEENRFLADTMKGFRIYDLAGDEPVVIPLDELGFGAISATFDPTGRYLAAVGAEGDAVVLDMEQLVEGASVGEAVVFDRTVDAGQMISLALDANGVLATTNFGSLRLWDIHSGELVVDIPVQGDGPSQPRVSPDGDYLYYVDQSDLGGLVVRRFPLDTDELIELAESRVFRGLTDDECLRYLDPTQCE